MDGLTFFPEIWMVWLDVVSSVQAEFRVRAPYLLSVQLVIYNTFKETRGLGLFPEFV